MNADRDDADRHQLWLYVLSNEAVAEQLEEVARLLEDQAANPFRIQAYRKAATTLRGLPRPVPELLDESGVAGLLQLPGIGRSLARSIEQMVCGGKLPLLERLRGEHAPERLFATVADIGPVLAHRIHDELEIETLAELEAAAWDGRLRQVPGMGTKRIQAVRESLAGRFRRRSARRFHSQPAEGAPVRRQQPAVAELLDVDQQYRRLAEEDRLPRISPRRFNPLGQAWLPILHTQRHDRHYTALYSNTARAHELGTTRDWVVIYRDDEGDDGQWTVITAQFGPLHGRRIVRGREAECAEYYSR
ncbi:MAG: DNA polymerase III [Pirellulaceae bacterium]|nr:DNA polymerase III [Pirellulaceae bacterium]